MTQTRRLRSLVGILLFMPWLILLTACSSENQPSKNEAETLSAQALPALKATLATTPVDTPPDTVEVAPEIAEEPLGEPISIDLLLGRVNPAKETLFVKIASQYTPKANIYMHKDAYTAFREMHEAAKADGIQLTILSATRNFNAQKSIWERKWTGQTKVAGKDLTVSHPDPVDRARMILTYSSMPGTSRHHWGTDIDLNNLNNPWFSSGEGKKVYEWLTANAATFGFCQPYSPKDENRPEGYNEEKWHWTYLPVARQYTRQYAQTVSYKDIAGFQGAEAAEAIDVINNYVLGINEACK